MDTLSRHSSFGIHVKPEAVHEQIEFCSGAVHIACRARGAGPRALPGGDGLARRGRRRCSFRWLWWRRRSSPGPTTRGFVSSIGGSATVFAITRVRSRRTRSTWVRPTPPMLSDLQSRPRFRRRFRSSWERRAPFGTASATASPATGSMSTMRRWVSPDKTGLPSRLESSDDMAGFVERNSLFGDPGSCYTYLRPRPERGVSVEFAASTSNRRWPRRWRSRHSPRRSCCPELIRMRWRIARPMRSAKLGARGVTDAPRTCALLDHLRVIPSSRRALVHRPHLGRGRVGARVAPSAASHRRLGTRACGGNWRTH